MIIDSHQHFWQLARGDYDWLTQDFSAIYRDFSPADLEPFLKEHDIQQTILVQAAATTAETEYLLKLADHHAFIAGVTGWVDMESDKAVDQLQQFSQHPKFLAIRPMIQDIPDDCWMLKPELAPAFDALPQLNIRFEALTLPKHLKHLLTLLERYPDLNTVINHCAKPPIKTQQWQPWADDIKAIATHTPAYCKVSALLEESNPNATLDDLKPYLDHVVDCFGIDRLIWGSNWPVLNLVSDYSSWLAMAQDYFSQFSPEAQAGVFGENAKRFYAI